MKILNPLKAQPNAGLFSPLRPLITLAVDILFPPRCHHCGRVDTHWCEDCQDSLEKRPCTPLTRFIEGLDGIVASGYHDGILQSAIHAFKYDDLISLSPFLVNRLSKSLKSQDWTINTIIPVPLHTSRQQKRGYNQSIVLGEQLAQLEGIPLATDALIRHQETRPQVGLNRRERMANVAEAFIAKQDVAGKTILLLDDVCTTGSTLVACANAARLAGATAIYALTLTFAQN